MEPEIIFDWLELPRKRIRQNKNVLGVFVGETGSGKSLAAISAALAMDPLFTVDHIHFTISDYIEDVRQIIEADEKGIPVCRTLILDEAAVDFDSRKSMSRENIAFSNLLKVFRYLNIVTFFTFPNLEMFDVNGRRLMHYLIVMAGIDKAHRKSYARLFLVDAHKTFGGEPKRYFAVIDVPNLGLRFQVDPIGFRQPPAKVLKAYDIKKKAYGKRMVKEMGESLSPASLDEAEEEAVAAATEKAEAPPRRKLARPY